MFVVNRSIKMLKNHWFANVRSVASLKPDSIDLAAVLGPIKAKP
jgi:hypothetical protein